LGLCAWVKSESKKERVNEMKKRIRLTKVEMYLTDVGSYVSAIKLVRWRTKLSLHNSRMVVDGYRLGKSKSTTVEIN
jgi:hypothetical protein